MRALRYSINVTLDGCVDHRAGRADPDLHRHAAETLAAADALIFGRTTYTMMEEAWRPPLSPDLPDWTRPFAETIDAARKHVVSTTLDHVDWNAEVLSGGDDLLDQILRLKAEPGGSLYTGGVTLPTALAELGLIDEYELIVHPTVAGHGPYLFEGLRTPLDLVERGRRSFPSGAVATRFAPREG